MPIKDDRRYRSWEHVPEPVANAVIIYMMDVSGSMTDEQKEIVRTESFWIDTWLRSQYQGLERRYIIHDAAAKEVDEHTFYHTRESGGTRISSAYKVCQDLIDRPSSIRPSGTSTASSFPTATTGAKTTGRPWACSRRHCCRKCNLFCYGQVESPYGSGEFYRVLEEAFGSEHETLVLSEIENKEGIYDSIKKFLGKGK